MVVWDEEPRTGIGAASEITNNVTKSSSYAERLARALLRDRLP